jgi:ABC-type Fe3+-hydroxamate transport system substrate-binding protein
MRAFEFLTEAETPAPKKVGREFNHLEDLVFTEPKGAQRAVQILKGLAQDAKDVAVKWDGNPTVYWGREPNGQFRMVGKNNWGREEGKSNSRKNSNNLL